MLGWRRPCLYSEGYSKLTEGKGFGQGSLPLKKDYLLAFEALEKMMA